jgi:predicted AlkP superfamily phosphohydrolase/phosphomutase
MKVFVLGLDGTTFDQLNPMMEEGILPNIKDICDNYTHGSLESIVPPVTGPAWLALATGLNPGKTGVFDYINKFSAESDEVTPVSPRYYKNRAVWDYLNKKGLKTGIFNYPTLLPAPEVNGFAIGGIGARGEDENLTFPKDLIKEIRAIAKDYKVILNLRNKKYEANMNDFFKDINKILEDQVEVLKYLIKNKDWDFFFSVLSVTDWIQHVCWKYIDEKHPLHNRWESEVPRKEYKKFWIRTDEVIGELLQILPKDINFLIVSDHGFGPLNSVFYPNSWLEDIGLLKKKKGMRLKGMILDKLKFMTESFDNKYTNAITYKIGSKLFKIKNAIDLIDLNKSLAYSPEHNTMFGCVNLTKKGKDTEGFKNKLINELKNLPNVYEGINSIEIILPEDVHSGPYVNLSPDIYFIINNYEATVEIPFDNTKFSNLPSVMLRTGSHRSNGIFLAKGEIFKNIQLNPSILDITPTILALYGVDIPSNIDGNVLKECIKEETLSKMKINIIEEKDSEKSVESDEEEVEKMKDMLKSLGYL